MTTEVLTPSEMAQADRMTIADGPFDGMALMRHAGAAVASVVLRRFAGVEKIHVLCGPGNNGGDGYVSAQILHDAGCVVSVWQDGAPRAGTDAAQAAAQCGVAAAALNGFEPERGALVIDALYGAGLSRPVGADAASAIAKVGVLGVPVLSIDLPSGVSGQSGAVLGRAFRADITVTFARRKPGHLLLPGKSQCGDVIVADIGIPDAVIDSLGIDCRVNDPALWIQALPRPASDTHKYRRGHVGVFSGGPSSTGAARLSAMAAARAGAGAVTILSPENALAVNAAHLTSIILRKADNADDVDAFLTERKPRALVFGPGLDPRKKVGDFALAMMARITSAPQVIVFDADALTSLALQPDSLFAAARRPGAPELILTPHEGEFARLFPDIAADGALSKLEKARAAAVRSPATIVFKGPDTVIAAPDGRAAINDNGTPLLATAGSGDVLSGICAALVAQHMPPFEACCAAVWIHAEAARRFGPGLIAEDLPLALLPVLRDILGWPSTNDPIKERTMTCGL